MLLKRLEKRTTEACFSFYIKIINCRTPVYSYIHVHTFLYDNTSIFCLGFQHLTASPKSSQATLNILYARLFPIIKKLLEVTNIYENGREKETLKRKREIILQRKR